jgi:hypothetical protein
MTDSVCGGCFRQTAKTSEREEALQLIAQEGDNALGPDDAHHAALRIDHRKCVEVVLIEPLGELVLLHLRRAREDAGLGEEA